MLFLARYTMADIPDSKTLAAYKELDNGIQKGWEIVVQQCMLVGSADHDNVSFFRYAGLCISFQPTLGITIIYVH